MNVLIKPNFESARALECTHAAAKKLAALGVGILFEDAAQPYISAAVACEFAKAEAAVVACDIVISVGGDGAIMRAVHSAVGAGKPVLGINAGHVGFLTQLEQHELDALSRLVSGEYGITQRMLLEASVQEDTIRRSFMALNDIVIRHMDSDRIAEIAVFGQGRPVGEYRADGVIFSTPTGSTAYSLSAGGPIASPELSLILMTAICPHSAFNASLVLPPQHVYTVCGKTAESLRISADGAQIGTLHPGNSVAVSRCSVQAQFIELGLREFYSNVNQKLSWGR